MLKLKGISSLMETKWLEEKKIVCVWAVRIRTIRILKSSKKAFHWPILRRILTVLWGRCWLQWGCVSLRLAGAGLRRVFQPGPRKTSRSVGQSEKDNVTINQHFLLTLYAEAKSKSVFCENSNLFLCHCSFWWGAFICTWRPSWKYLTCDW